MGLPGGGSGGTPKIPTVNQILGNSQSGNMTGGSNLPFGGNPNTNSVGPVGDTVNKVSGQTIQPPGTYSNGGGGSGGMAGLPAFPGLQQAVDGSGHLTLPASNILQTSDGTPVDPTGFDALKGYATKNGQMDFSASPWLQQQTANVNAQVQGMKDQNAASAAAGVQGASDAAATHGGLTGGGSARLGAASLMGLAGANQGANQAGFQTNNQNAVTDMQTKLGVAGGLGQQSATVALPAQQNQQFNAGQGNTVGAGNADRDVGAIGQANSGALQKYGADISAFIGNKLGDSMAASGKKKG